MEHLTRMDFERLVLQAAIDSAGSRRANSYARVDAVVDARAPALGKSYESYLAGEYWAREWVKQGARREKMVSEFPAVLLESRRTELPDGLEVNNARIHYRLYVLHKIQCDECKVKPTPVQVSQLCHDLLWGILQEVTDAAWFTGTDADSEAYAAWLSQGRATALEGQDYDLHLDMPITIHIQEPSEIFQFGNLPDHRIAMCEFSVDTCEAPLLEFSYNFVPGRKAGDTQCPC